MLLAFSTLKYPCVPGIKLVSRSVHAVGFQYLEVPRFAYSPLSVEAGCMGVYQGANWYRGLYILLGFSIEVPRLSYSPHSVEAGHMGMYPIANWYQGLYILLVLSTSEYPGEYL